MQSLLDNFIFLPNCHHNEFCSLHILQIRKTNASNRNPFEESDETRDHVEYKAMAYQRSKTSDNNPITYPPVILSCLNSTIMGELCACAAERHKITSRGVCFLPSQCAPCLPLREKGLMLAWYCIRLPQ